MSISNNNNDKWEMIILMKYVLICEIMCVILILMCNVCVSNDIMK